MGRGAVRVAVSILAAITALQALGVPVAPLLTTLGVGSLAVALALQDTLANFFAGIYLLADRPVGAGDYIKLHDGEEGYVEAIGWRSSRLRTAAGSAVIVPNQKLSQAILTNFHRPTPKVVMTIAITVAYGADVAAVEAALADELRRATGEVAELREAKPIVRFTDLTSPARSGALSSRCRPSSRRGSPATSCASGSSSGSRKSTWRWAFRNGSSKIQKMRDR